jgi:mRNA interferase RelE/StbE
MCAVNYSIKIKRSAAKQLRRLAESDKRRVVAAIDRLASEPHAGSVLKGEFAGLRRLRVGDYRIIYEAVDRQLIVLVVRVAQRGSAYRGG